MQVVRSESECPRPDEGSVVTIGAYDGVHLGHRTVIGEVVARARAEGRRSAVVTFDRHPAQVIRPESAPLLLTDLDQKLELLRGTGVDIAVVIHFDEERSRESAAEFVLDTLVDCLRAREVVVGEDFHFGHRRTGNVELLREMGAVHGFSVTGHRLVGPDGRAARDDEQVSSTAIRRALHEGRLADANAMLGRPHEMRGPVVPGDRRGRELGFPTANVAIGDEMLMPADGIYAGELVRPPGSEPAVLPSAIYVGKRPTFYDDRAVTLLEVHALDFSGDLYGEDVAVRFLHRIRPDARFASVEELTVQLRRDCDEAAHLLGV
ncbi:MAG: bifunctional riboflavin kinase/FAD synthetase [Microthrixaceae bacterium]